MFVPFAGCQTRSERPRNQLARSALSAALFLSLCACASFSNHPFNAAANQSIERIGFLPLGADNAVDLVIANHLGDNFGLIGVLIAEYDRGRKEGRFQDMAQSHSYRPAPKLREAIKTELTKAGYKLVFQPASRPDGQAFFEAYPAPVAAVDAFLDVYTGIVGYLTPGGDSVFRPTAYIAARLVRATDGEVLFAERFLVNAYGKAPDGVVIAPPTAFQFKDVDAVVNADKRALRGVDIAIQMAAASLADHLAK